MRMTHSTAAERSAASKARRSKGRPVELLGLLAGTVLTIAGLWLVSSARAEMLADTSRGLSAGAIANLNVTDRAEQLLPRLESVVADAGERRFVADRLASWLNTPDGSGSPRRQVSGINAVGTIMVTDQDLPAKQRMPTFRERLVERRDQLGSNPKGLTI